MDPLEEARQRFYAPSARFSIVKTNYTHDACIDVLITNPAITQNELAETFGYSVPWMSRVINSDAFQERLAARKDEILDPLLKQEVEAGFRALVQNSMQILLEKLEETRDAGLALKTLDLGSRALGYGARTQPVAVQTSVSVAVVPAKSASSAEWVRDFAPKVRIAGPEEGEG